MNDDVKFSIAEYQTSLYDMILKKKKALRKKHKESRLSKKK